MIKFNFIIPPDSSQAQTEPNSIIPRCGIRQKFSTSSSLFPIYLKDYLQKRCEMDRKVEHVGNCVYILCYLIFLFYSLRLYSSDQRIYAFFISPASRNNKDSIARNKADSCNIS